MANADGKTLTSTQHEKIVQVVTTELTSSKNNLESNLEVKEDTLNMSSNSNASGNTNNTVIKTTTTVTTTTTTVNNLEPTELINEDTIEAIRRRSSANSQKFNEKTDTKQQQQQANEVARNEDIEAEDEGKTFFNSSPKSKVNSPLHATNGSGRKPPQRQSTLRRFLKL